MGKSSRNNRRRCMWFGCPDHHMVADDITMCWQHARIIHGRIQQVEERGNQRLLAAWEKNEQLQVAEQVERIKAGKPERTDLYYKAPQQWVYYIKNGDQIKIGFTTNLGQRLRQYPPNVEILGVEYGDEDLEKTRHDQFNAYLAYGREWFHDTQEIRDHIATLPPMTHLGIKRMRRGPANGTETVKPRYWR